MTREEAIKYLKEMKDECNDTIHKVRYVTQEEVLDMAIKALEQEPSGEWIRRQDVIKVLTKNRVHFYDMVKITSELKKLPSVKQEPKTGHWIEKDGYDGDTYYDCSECGESFCLIDGTPTDNLYNYCPNCGAKMIEPQERSDKK